MKKLLIIFILFSSVVNGQTTYDTTITKNVSGTDFTWRFRVTLPPNYTALCANPSNTFPGVLYFMALGEVGTDTSKIAVYGPHKYIRNGGKIFYKTAAGDTLWPVVISIQPTSAYPNEILQKAFIDDLISRYKLRKHTGLYGIGYSHGGWCFKTYATGDAYGTYGSTSYAYYYTALMDILGMKPDDNTPYPNLFDNYANAGGKAYFAEQLNDGRDQATQASRMNSAVSGSATYRLYNFGDGGHTCCVDNWLGGTSAPVDTFLILGKTGSIYTRALAIGDTTIPTVASGPPVANAGVDQTIYMPITSVTLNGSGTTGTATTVLWTKLSGGVKSQEGTVSSATSLVASATDIGVGVYTYELSVSDGVTTSKDTVTVTGYQHKSRIPSPNYETFTLTPSGGEIYYTDLMASFPTLNGGDTLIIASNVSGVVQLYGAGSDGGWGGDSIYPVVIRPATGSSQITIGGAMRINGQYIRIMGEYNQSRGVQYGFKFNGVTQGIVATTKHSNLTAKWCEFTTVENGTYWKCQVDSTDVLSYYPHWKFNNDTVMYCKMYSTNGEAMYMGHTFFFDGGQPASGYQPVPHDGLYIGYDSVTNAGWDGIQISNAFNTTIERNYINTTGTLNISSQLYGIIFGGLSWGTVRYNTIKKAASSGIAIFGKDTVRVYGNTIDSCGGTGIDAPFTSMYINDNTVPLNPYTYPDLIYYVQDNCISNMSSYSGGAAIRSTNSNGTTRPSFITGNTIYDPSGRSLSSLISTAETGTTKSNTLGVCIVTPNYRWHKPANSRVVIQH